MRKLTSLIPASALVAMFLTAPLPAAASATCTPTGFGGLTAAQIGGAVSGALDASGCDIGVYFDTAHPGTVSSADIHGAGLYGVLVNGDNGPVAVNVTGSSIHDVGSLGIYYRAYLGGAAAGQIADNNIFNYGAEGIVTTGPGTIVQIQDNIVTGSAGVSWNVGIPCAYTLGTQIVNNTLTDNDIGVWLSNCADANCGTTSQTATNIKVVNDTITDGSHFNGYYQAGVSDVGNNDKIIANMISGAGYDPTVCSYCFLIDASMPYSLGVKVHANSTE